MTKRCLTIVVVVALVMMGLGVSGAYCADAKSNHERLHHPRSR